MSLSIASSPIIEKDRFSCFYKMNRPLTRNLLRVTLAGGLSFAGGVLSGHPEVIAIMGVAAVFFGSFISGIGNGVSTWLAWETGLEGRIAHLETEIAQLKEILNIFENHAAATENLSAQTQENLIEVV